MTVAWVIFLFVFQLLILGSIVIVAHRVRTWFGLLPLLAVIGGYAAALQFHSFGVINLRVIGLKLTLMPGSYLLEPAILLGLLLVYIVDGTTQARVVLLGVLAVTFVAAVFQLFPSLMVKGAGFDLRTSSTGGATLRMLIASAISMAIDLPVLILVYQLTSNWRARHPSLLAGTVALLAGMISNALTFSTLAFIGTPDWADNLFAGFTGGIFAALILWPVLAIYLYRIMPMFPDSAGVTRRPVLDLFTTALQLEARARLHHQLLRTLSQINQLIVRTSDPDELLHNACRYMAENRDYQFVWIGLVENGSESIRLMAYAGEEAGDLSSFAVAQVGLPKDTTPAYQVIQTGHAVIIPDLTAYPDSSLWQQTALEQGLRVLACLPMHRAAKVVGVFSVYSSHPKGFDQEELNLFQELADDLVYALGNLHLRHHQAILQTAAETMRDGLVIMELAGEITYVNPAIAQMLELTPETLVGRNIHALLSGEMEKVYQTYRQALLKQGQVVAEFENTLPNGRPIFASVNASLVYDADHAPSHIVLSVSDISQRRQYEHQLLTLNRLVTELVQIRDPKDLLDTLLLAGEDLLGANASSIYLLDTDQKRIVEYIAHNLPDEYARKIKASFRGLPGEDALKTLQPVYVEDTLSDPVYQGRVLFMAEYGVRALLILPVLYQGLALGGLVMYYPEPHRFQEQEVQLGLTLAYTLAIAIQNARLYQSEHSQRQLAEALSQAAFSLNRSLNLDEVLDQILEQTRRVAACNSVNIMLVEGKAAYVARRRGYESHPEHVRTMDALVFPLNSPTLQHMLTNGQPVLVQDTARDPLWSALEGAEWVKSYASAPLQIGEQVLGFLNVDSDLAGFFSEETTRRLQAFAAHAAIAIQNARLYQQLQQYNIELRERVLERTAELQAAKERIEGILASVPDAVFVLDDLNQLIQANQAGEVLLSQAIEQDLDLFAAEFLAQLAGGLLPSEKAVVEVKGRAYQALASRLPIDPLKSGLVIVFRDVTRFRELDQMKTQFVSDVSHELRTPLTNLTLYLDLLSAVEDAAKRQSYLDTLRRETGRLTHLIEDLLTISRLEAGRLRVNTRPMNVNVLVTDLAQDRAYMASGKELTLLHETMSDIPMALADSLLLNQCISNLLTNAINYTPPGGTIRLQTSLGQSDGSSWVIIHVADTGVGILPEEREHIFERFYRGSASRNTGASGTGLGLAISKEILDRMNAKITVESEPGKGSTFTIWLPAVL